LLPFDLFFIAILTFIIFILFFIFVYFVLFLCDFNPHDFFIYNAFGLITRIMIQKVNSILLFLSYIFIFLSMKSFYSYLIFILLTNKIIEMFLEYYEDIFPYFWQAIIFCIELLFFSVLFIVDILFSNVIIKLTEFIKLTPTNYWNVIFFLKKYLSFLIFLCQNKG
jgi:hypothetical protein